MLFQDFIAFITGRIHDAYDGIRDLSFSADGSRWGFQYINNLKWYVNVNGKTYGGYSLISYEFTPEGDIRVLYEQDYQYNFNIMKIAIKP
jgi:hypothetical protein